RDAHGSRTGGSSVSAERGMRILMTADAVGGVWQYATDLAASLTAAGHEVTPAVLGPAASLAQRGGAEAIEGLTLIETGLPLDWLSDGPEPVEQAAAALARLAVETGADLVHCNMPTLAGAAQFPMPLITVTHGCVATWWQAAKNEPLAPDYRWHRAMMGRGLAAADAVVAPSAAYAATIKRTYRLSAMPRVVHNGRVPICEPVEGAEPMQAALTVGRLWDRVKMPQCSTGRQPRSIPRSSPPVRRPDRMGRPWRWPTSIWPAKSVPANSAPSWRSGRSSSRPPRSSRSASLYWKRRRPAARWCCRTSPRSVSCGTAPRASSTPTMRTASLRRSRLCSVIASSARRSAEPPRGARSASLRPLRPPACGRFTQSVWADGRRRHEDRLFHSLAGVVLEPRQRPFPARRARRADRAWARGRGPRAGRRLEPRQSAD